MANTVEAYLAEYRMDRKDYLAGSKDIIHANKAMEESSKKLNSTFATTQARLKNQFKEVAKPPASKGGGDVGDWMQKNIGTMSDLGPLKQVVGVVGGLYAAGIAAAIGASSAAAEFDSLVKSLEAVDGGSKNAEKSLADLKKLAKEPGLGFEQAVRAYAGLRNSDLTQSFSETLIKEFANANARAGGGMEQFDRVMLAIRQIAVKPQLHGQELLQLNEAGIPVQTLLQKHFGTSDTEKLAAAGISSKQILEGLVQELEKLPRVAGGAKNSLDNFQDAMHFAIIDIGTGINNHMLGGLDKASDEATALGDAGYWSSLGDTVGQAFEDALGATNWTETFDAMATGITAMAVGMRNLTQNAEGAGTGARKAWRWATTWGTHWDDKIDSDGLDTASETERSMKVLHEQTLWGAAKKGNTKFLEDHQDWMEDETPQMRKSLLALAKRNSKKTFGDKVAEAVAAPDPHLIDISHNTRRTADILQKQYDREQRIIGGGAIGGKGLTPIELSGMRRAGGAHAKLHRIMGDFLFAITEYASQVSDSNQTYNSRMGYAD